MHITAVNFFPVAEISQSMSKVASTDSVSECTALEAKPVTNTENKPSSAALVAETLKPGATDRKSKIVIAEMDEQKREGKTDMSRSSDGTPKQENASSLKHGYAGHALESPSGDPGYDSRDEHDPKSSSADISESMNDQNVPANSNDHDKTNHDSPAQVSQQPVGSSSSTQASTETNEDGTNAYLVPGLRGDVHAVNQMDLRNRHSFSKPQQVQKTNEKQPLSLGNALLYMPIIIVDGQQQTIIICSAICFCTLVVCAYMLAITYIIYRH